MKSITLHNIDKDLYNAIKHYADSNNLSLNKAMKELLAQSLNVNTTNKRRKKHDFSRFCGIWSDEEAREFEKRITDHEKIDWEEWK